MSSHSPDTDPPIVIIGAGIAGLACALALMNDDRHIIIYEKDPQPDFNPEHGRVHGIDQWPRKGCPQFNHPHALLGLLVQLIKTHHPNLLRSLLDHGAWIANAQQLAPEGIRKQLSHDQDISLLYARRAVFEWVLYCYVAAHPHVDIIHDHSVLDGTLSSASLSSASLSSSSSADRSYQRIKSLTVLSKIDHSLKTLIPSQVIDACGQASLFPGLLRRHGVVIKRLEYKNSLLYFSRYYQAINHNEFKQRINELTVGDLGYLKYGVFPADNGYFGISITIPRHEEQLRKTLITEHGFTQVCQALHMIEPWQNPRFAAPVSGIAYMNYASSYYHIYTAKLMDFFAVGESLLRTNPIYGAGSSLSFMQAYLLKATLDNPRLTPKTQQEYYIESIRKHIGPYFRHFINEDRASAKRAKRVLHKSVESAHTTPARSPFKTRLLVSLSRALMAASQQHAIVWQAFMRVYMLLDHPTTPLQNPKIMWIIFLYWCRGRKRNIDAITVKPLSRNALLAHLEEQH